MEIVHWTLDNGSGLNRVSIGLSSMECQQGLDSYVCYPIHEPNVPHPPPNPSLPVKVLEMKDAMEADVHVIHSHVPDGMKGKKIFVAHGTPEFCFADSFLKGQANMHAGDPFMLSIYRINHTDATVTFWPRHQYIWMALAPKADIRQIPLGVDMDFWKPVQAAKSAGFPSMLTCENLVPVKWPLDIILAFPLVMEVCPGVILHMHYIPAGAHKWWYPLIHYSGVAYKSFSSSAYLGIEALRVTYCSVDYYISPVRYGDYNNVCLEAKACGCKVISYRGNEYADYWIDEGDQRTIAKQIAMIIRGDTKPREDIKPVPSLKEMSDSMIEIYKDII